jgi:fructose-1,6-bisphosphatase II
MMWPRDNAERQEILDAGYEADLDKVFFADDLAHGQNIIFCATGISDSPLVKGVQIKKRMAVTHSVLMRAKSRTLRHITAYHDLNQKTIHLRSDNREHRI